MGRASSGSTARLLRPTRLERKGGSGGSAGHPTGPLRHAGKTCDWNNQVVAKSHNQADFWSSFGNLKMGIKLNNNRGSSIYQPRLRKIPTICQVKLDELKMTAGKTGWEQTINKYKGYFRSCSGKTYLNRYWIIPESCSS